MASSHMKPFNIQSSDRYKDADQDSEAQDLLHENDSRSNEEEEEDDIERRRQYMNTSIGDLYQLNSSRSGNDNSSLSFNFILLCLLGLLIAFGLGYYGLSKREQREIHANELQEQLELERLKEKYGLVELDKRTSEEKSAGITEYQTEKDKHASDNSEQDKQHESVSTSKSHQPEIFDPFHLHINHNHKQQQINSHVNDWFGAPFIVSPPQMPSFVANGGLNADGTASSQSGRSRMGYFQYPTIDNSTLVFSSEGELYLTRVPVTISTNAALEPSMPAMKLTTTVNGNAIHPKLNHKYPHLLAYSATYSGVREVYLMDLRGITQNNGVDIPMNVPGSPGGPALRLTYTTGGILSVVGWDEDGTSIMYSAWNDQVGMRDVRLYRLRLSSMGSGVGEDGMNNSTADAREDELDQSEDESNNTLSVDANNETNHTEYKYKRKEKGGDNQNERSLKWQEERQRRHAAKLSSSRSRRGVAESIIHPIIEPVPLSEAVDGVYHTTSQNGIQCIFFTRVKQIINTKRYMGGTTENLWSYCPGDFDDLAIPLTEDYNGTSKSPMVYSQGGLGDWLFFMSDRAVYSNGVAETENQTQTMDWIASSMDLWAAQLPITASGFSSTPIRLTNVACNHNGMDLMEYAVDPSNGAVALRIGADIHYMPMEAIKEKLYPSKEASGEYRIQQLPIAVYSDFSKMQERIIPLEISDYTSVDVYATSYGVSALLTARGQTFVAPVIPDQEAVHRETNYAGGGRNMPPRRYKVAPGTGFEGFVRILCAINIPSPKTDDDSGERNALVLATDPLSPTGEHAFYIIRTDAMASPSFSFAALYESETQTGLPVPFLGGHLDTGGSTKDGGLGSIYPKTVTLSPCGRRLAFTNSDGRIILVTLPIHQKGDDLESVDMIVLPSENEIGQPMVGDRQTNLVWSPGGRYLAIEHHARNTFKVISISELGSPEVGSLQLGRIVQVTADRFNSFSAFWGRESKDFAVDEYVSKLKLSETSHGGATALFFLSDRDTNLEGDSSPLGAKALSRFSGRSCVHVLPLRSLKDSIKSNEINAYIPASFGGGGASELSAQGVQEQDSMLKSINAKSAAREKPDDAASKAQPYVIDTSISFGEEKDTSFKFGRTAYRLDSTPAGSYVKIVCQFSDHPSLLLVTNTRDSDLNLSLLATGDYLSDRIKDVSLYDAGIEAVDMSTDGDYMLITSSNNLQVVPRTISKLLSLAKDANMAFTSGLHVIIWPALEYQQIYADSWRLLRDYDYDADLNLVEWNEVFDRYLPLVERCSNREELDDVMRQMGGELSAFQVFVKGGAPTHGDNIYDMEEIASLGATLRRSTEMNGYEVIEIPESDPDFLINGEPMYSPLSDRVLSLTGQQGLESGDVIVGVNGEHVLNVPSINMLLRGKAGESVRLEVQRVTSRSDLTNLRRAKFRLLNENNTAKESLLPEPLLVVPLSVDARDDLIYAAWEWKTKERAMALAAEAGFTLGYVHVQDMSEASAESALAKVFYADHDKQALIIDIRHSLGGNIGSWLLNTLQRKAWMHWLGREGTNDGRMWDEQLAFQGHLVVLIDEKTSSDAEAFARGVAELGLGKLVGIRSWGGGIRLSSDNTLIDAPEFGWGMGVEQIGVVPDEEIENNPRDAYEGRDKQLEVAVSVLKDWLQEEAVVFPKSRPKIMNKWTKDYEGCNV